MVVDNERPSRQERAERYTIDAVANALSILGAIASRPVLGLSEAAEVGGVSRSTAYRLLATLEWAGLVERLPEGGYRAGVGAIRWATQLLAQLSVRTVAEPYLRQLRDESGETVNLAVLRDRVLVYVEILESPAAFRMADAPGTIAPIHSTALGKAVATHLDPTRLAAILGPEPYQRFTTATATTWPQLSGRLDEARARGYATDLEEAAAGVVCVAAAVVVRGAVVGAISVSAPRARMDDQRVAATGARLREIADRIAARL